jgi:hypothetical protein
MIRASPLGTIYRPKPATLLTNTTWVGGGGTAWPPPPPPEYIPPPPLTRPPERPQRRTGVRRLPGQVY